MTSASAFSFRTTSSTFVLSLAGFSSEDSACAASERKLPSQLSLKLREALKTVRVSNESEALLAAAPLVRMLWQDEQESFPFADKRGSLKRRSPSASLSGSATGGCGIGVIGSSSVTGLAGDNSKGRGGACATATSASTAHKQIQPSQWEARKRNTNAGGPSRIIRAGLHALRCIRYRPGRYRCRVASDRRGFAVRQSLGAGRIPCGMSTAAEPRPQ